MTWLLISVIALAAGAPTTALQLATQMALVPTWFLAAYLLVIVVAPPLLVLWGALRLVVASSAGSCWPDWWMP